MDRKTTEQRNESACNIDAIDVDAAAAILFGGQVAAAKAVESALPKLVQASALLTQSVLQGGNLIYCAAGSSGLMALADGLELPGTYGIPHERIKILLAGGNAALKELRGGPEDDEDLAAQDVKEANLSSKDAIIVLSASGTTPYAVKALSIANSIGVKSIAIANNSNTPLLNQADVGVYLPTPPEVIAGSTRMGAGSAQKIALNIMSTLMAIELGHVHDGHMVNLIADNEKLVQRARLMVVGISGCDEASAEAALKESAGAVKPAVLLASGARDKETAHNILESNGQKLRPSLSMLKESEGSKLKKA
ncbi:MAG: N-acetylmuramic acid 6-phosphate etherase [Lentilitoribacter sp.]